MAGTGSDETRLIILRGNSASGKSSTAAEIRRRHARRDLAIVGQDNLRRDVLREHDIPAGTNIGLIDLVARYALSHGFNVIVEGILCADHYAEMLGALIEDHQGLTYCYYFDVPFDETVKRHAAKPQASKYGGAEMRAWYRELDLLPGVTEQVIPAAMTQDETVRRIMADSGLAAETAQNSPLAGRASATTSVHSEAIPNPAFTCSPVHLPEGPSTRPHRAARRAVAHNYDAKLESPLRAAAPRPRPPVPPSYDPGVHR